MHSTMTRGDRFNESTVFPDTVTSRPTRRLTCKGLYNETPTYHFNAAFSKDSRFLLFATAREGGSALMKAEVATGELTVLAVADGIGNGFGDDSHAPFVKGTLGGGFAGNHTAIAQETNWCAAAIGRTLRAYHLETMEERVLIEDIGPEFRFGNPVSSIDGKSVLVTRVPKHPDVVRGDPRPKRTYIQACNEEWGGMPTTYLRVSIDTGRVEEVFHDPKFGSHHIQPCPSDPDLWLIDRDSPPSFWCGGDAFRSTRAYVLDSRTGGLTEIPPLDEHRFQIHTNWNRTGERIYYHGFAQAGGTYIGVADKTGKNLWERHFPASHYGHVSTHTMAEAIITDGLLTSDLVLAIFYEELDATGTPRLEIIARHETVWGGLAGQYPHPHCHMSPDGKWLAYNKADFGRTDVYVVQM